jgi:hypothetical protein
MPADSHDATRNSRSLYRVVTVLITVLLLGAGGCATWQPPANPDDAALRARAVTDTVNGVTLSASVLSAADSEQLFGTDINAGGVQPVWIEVRNDSTHTLWLLRSGTDPNYFSPLEVAWPLHSKLAKQSNARIDDYFDSLAFQNPIPPGTTRTGILFTNHHQGTHVLNVDLLGQQTIFPFTLFLPVPGEQAAVVYETIIRYADSRNLDYQDPDELRSALEQLPCCADGGDPVNMVFIGRFADIAAAVIRRGYRTTQYDSDTRQRLFGRPPEAVLRKSAQGSPANWLRMWVAPFRYQGKPVILVQSGRPVGGRFETAGSRKQQLHPNVDETRNLTIQDLLYSGGLAQLGFVDGVGAVPGTAAETGDTDIYYYTDGLRAVLFFVTRPLALSDIEILDWVPLLQQREADAATHSTDQ